MHHIKIDINKIREQLEYNPATGALTWKRSRGKRPAGAIAGWKSNGYRDICVCGHKYKAHRLAWALHTDKDPEDMEVDHINGDKDDNRACNLRLIKREQQMMNVRWTGLTGVRQLPSKQWQARITQGNTTVSLGTYPCPLLAHVAYVDRARELRGEYAAV
jgi:hypothetical protein